MCISSTPQSVLPRKLWVNSGRGHYFALIPRQEKSKLFKKLLFVPAAEKRTVRLRNQCC